MNDDDAPIHCGTCLRPFTDPLMDSLECPHCGADINGWITAENVAAQRAAAERDLAEWSALQAEVMGTKPMERRK